MHNNNFFSHNMNIIQVDDAPNAAIEPLVAVLKDVIEPKETFDMAGSAFKVHDTDKPSRHSLDISFFPDY